MKTYFSFMLAVLLTSCVSNEQRISDFQGRCKLIGYESNSEAGKACVLELEKQYIMATSRLNSNIQNNSVNSPASNNTNSSTKKDACMFNPSNSRYETCYHVTAGGTCAHFGSICTP